jgi:tRNA threonylcarbamoyladenosine biosynthesis protein TsaB
MALILQIETATQTCSVALAEDGKLLHLIEKTEKNIHAAVITLFIEELLEKSNKKFSDLDAVAVSMGPGSYTGLRIGVSTAKGICFALDIPLIGINTLEAMSSGFIDNCFSVNKQAVFCPMIDARRMEVYCAVFNSENRVILPTEAKIIEDQAFADLFKEHVIYFFGDGAAKCEDILSQNLNARVMDDFTNSASFLTKLALERYLKKRFEDVAYFEPYYLKDFIVGKKVSE